MLKIVTRIPHASTACVGLRSTVDGHRGNINCEASCVEEYKLKPLEAHPMMTTPAIKVMNETAMRAQWRYPANLWYRSAKTSLGE